MGKGLSGHVVDYYGILVLVGVLVVEIVVGMVGV